MSWLEAEFGKWVVKRRWWLISATLLLVLVVGSGTSFLTFNSDLRVFFSEENPQLQALEALETTYSKIDNILFVTARQDGDVFTRETFAAVEELTEASLQMPYSNRSEQKHMGAAACRPWNRAQLLHSFCQSARLSIPVENCRGEGR